MDIPQQTFYCQCKGCPNGEGFAFEDAPENWWTRKGMKPPKNCKQCRKWIKSQVDEEVRCSECRGAIRLPARYKIRYHKRIGVYTKPLLCTSCTWNKKRGKKPLPRLTRAEYDEEKLNEKKRAEKYRKHPKTSQARSYTSSTNPADYQHLAINKHTRSLET